MKLNYYNNITYIFYENQAWFKAKDIALGLKIATCNVPKRKGINSKLLPCPDSKRLSTFVDYNSLLLCFNYDPLLIEKLQSCVKLGNVIDYTNILKTAYYYATQLSSVNITLPSLKPLTKEALDKAIINKVPAVYSALLLLYTKHYFWEDKNESTKDSQVASYVLNYALNAVFPVTCDAAELLKLFNEEPISGLTLSCICACDIFLDYVTPDFSAKLSQYQLSNAINSVLRSCLSSPLNKNYFEYPRTTPVFIDPMTAFM
jgi:hypothetical protein